MSLMYYGDIIFTHFVHLEYNRYVFVRKYVILFVQISSVALHCGSSTLNYPFIIYKTDKPFLIKYQNFYSSYWIGTFCASEFWEINYSGIYG